MELKTLLGEELFTKVSEKLNGHQVIVADKDEKYIKDDGNLISKDESNKIITQRLSEVTEQKRVLTENNQSLKDQLEQLKAQNKGNQDLTQKIQELQDQISGKDKEIISIQKRSALSNTLITKAQAKYPELVMDKFDLDKLEITNGEIKDFDNLINPIKEKYPELFGAKPKPAGDGGNNGDRGSIVLSTSQQKEMHTMFDHLVEYQKPDGSADEEKMINAYAEVRNLNKGQE